MNETQYFAQGSDKNRFKVVALGDVKTGTLRYLLKDADPNSHIVYLKGQPFPLMYDHWDEMPKTEAEAWEQMPEWAG